jgi:hypothetical protein
MKTTASKTTEAELPSVRSEPLLASRLDELCEIMVRRWSTKLRHCVSDQYGPTKEAHDDFETLRQQIALEANASADRPAATAGTVRPDVGQNQEGKA